MNLNLQGKTAVVTGASVGIGRSIVKILAGEGINVAAVARRDHLIHEMIKGEDLGSRVIAIQADLVDANSPAVAARRATEELGPIDILVNCAGGSRPASVTSADAYWDEAMVLNFTSARRLATELLPAMQRRSWGRIINISGIVEPRKLAAGTVAKGALQTWSKSLSCDIAKDGVTVNCIQPGRVASEQILQRVHPTEESRIEFIRQHIPAGHFGVPEDVANLVAYLASPLAQYITGTTIAVDGGMQHSIF